MRREERKNPFLPGRAARSSALGRKRFIDRAFL
jgi:hypothetical protein